ncbi:MAG TPA: BTAD domain-containing putative transcriptional regulator [Longimicrobium sp.]|jgi:DNA-binding SARP family transcriptional activator|uniref:BTAD domain-containing putative transcriptional regulator n=1 Tax=Longimicrobium sp. TaxID=2029185 RepID=UPI002ED9D4C5
MAAVYLKTLGHPALYRAGGSAAKGLRRKDVALLVYLCVEGAAVHARGRLASLLWGESPEERARHSLTQALGRLTRALPPGALVVEKEVVRTGTPLECDAVVLLRGGLEPGEVDDAFSVYGGPFLEGFDPGAGAEEFMEWADRRRAELRNAALRLLERAGDEAAAAGRWARALRLAERGVEIDPVWEQGHRMLMRAQAASGERNRALRHYQAFEAWLAEEVGAEPDPETRALAELLRVSEPADAPPPPAPRPSSPAPLPAPLPAFTFEREPRPAPEALPIAAPTQEAKPEREPGPELGPEQEESGCEPESAPEPTLEVRPEPGPSLPPGTGEPRPPSAPLPRPAWIGGGAPEGAHIQPRRWDLGMRWHRPADAHWLPAPLGITLLVLVLIGAAIRGCMPDARADTLAAGHEENVRPGGSAPEYLVFGNTLYARAPAPDGRTRWITYPGGALAVGDTLALPTHCPAPSDAPP